ncbi:hypothetical protein HELRODRAFT_187911 [Helobdella robusta]|uniref:tRNA N(3)-methylcytidine methyltransferase n=1 Tax=Helobdella robusta TaxID=6412 RepID=T1FPG8_HELRO|nr:hypothetical protein HELRODRAFT_187911 [Helobdella robusta]ESO12559.1 hypothetical protein HELRODRAFT_187911 [Helobdella robusta]
MSLKQIFKFFKTSAPSLSYSRCIFCTSETLKNSNNGKRPPRVNRPLLDANKVFQFNNWDNVDWDEEMESDARKKVEANSTIKLSSDEQEKYEKDANKYWDAFYSQHQNRFFKDRNWLFTEFAELASHRNSSSDSADPETTSNETYPGEKASTRIFEVGCGVGNTIFPLLEANNDPHLFVYGCDLSATAIQIVKEHSSYDPNRCHAFVADISDQQTQLPFPPASLDFIILIFVLSAIKPDKMLDTIRRLSAYLKPGGMVLFRDYGRYDMAQLRIKKGKCLEDNFYIRGDGTRVYFFKQDELRELFVKAGLAEEQCYVDRRLQVNRGRQLKMFRVWIQCKYRLNPTTLPRSIDNVHGSK